MNNDNPYNHKFSKKKKYYNSFQVSTGIEGWYFYTKTNSPGGTRILRSTSPPSKIIKNKTASISSKCIQVDNELNQFIQELTSNTTNSLLNLYLKIINAERNENPNAVLERYYFLGEELEKRFENYKKLMTVLEAQWKVSKEVRAQLPKEITNADIHKITIIARKINNFFVRLSDDKVQRMAYVQRINTFTANYISRLSPDDINYVVSLVKKN